VTNAAELTEGAVRPHRPIAAGSWIEPKRTDLIAEVERYLATVELFRAEGCEPHWRREPRAAIDSAVTRRDGGSVR